MMYTLTPSFEQNHSNQSNPDKWIPLEGPPQQIDMIFGSGRFQPTHDSSLITSSFS